MRFFTRFVQAFRLHMPSVFAHPQCVYCKGRVWPLQSKKVIMDQSVHDSLWKACWTEMIFEVSRTRLIIQCLRDIGNDVVREEMITEVEKEIPNIRWLALVRWTE